ncbi:hypothetical protein ACEU2D_24515 [Brevibacillus laterosporus]|uniref:DUF7674 family protein n=1 Tax=Brevibacillus laterosporus TaxID=1465 RepID=UPI0035A58C44
MEYNDLVQTLLVEIPELNPVYEEEIEWLKEDLPHVIFGIVFNPYLIEILNLHDQEKKLKAIFIFLEKMAMSSDEKVKEVLVTTILESLLTERNIIVKAKHYMGSVTKKFCEQLEIAYGY